MRFQLDFKDPVLHLSSSFSCWLRFVPQSSRPVPSPYLCLLWVLSKKMKKKGRKEISKKQSWGITVYSDIQIIQGGPAFYKSFCLTDLFPKLSQPWNMCLTDTCWQNPVDKVLRKARLDYISVPAFILSFFFSFLFYIYLHFQEQQNFIISAKLTLAFLSFFLLNTISSPSPASYPAASSPPYVLSLSSSSFFFLHHSHELYLHTNAMWIPLLALVSS